MKINKNIYQLFFSIIAGLGVGLVLTYAFNVNASGLASSLTVDYGSSFNNLVSGDSNKVIITNTGNVGIGTASPGSYKLKVYGDMNVSSGTLLAQGGGTLDSFKAFANNTSSALVAEQGDADGYAVYSTGGKNYFQGNVGIGTESAGSKLNVAGRIYQSGLGFSTFVGYQAGNSDDLTSNYNAALGYQALATNTTSSYNTALGYQALYSHTTGDSNTALGYQALYSRPTSSNNTVLGAFANTASGGLTNATAIGYGATVDASNKVRIGNVSVTSIGGQVGWSNFSDARGKYDVKDYAYGLDFITKLRSVEFKLKDDTTDKIHSGFIAQEVEAIGMPFYGLNKPETEKSFYSLTYSEFVVPLVNSVQEQQKQIEELKKEIEVLKQNK